MGRGEGGLGMNLQDICTSLETSRKLAEAGFEREGGIAYWVDNEIEVTGCEPSEIEYECTHWSGGENCRRDCSKCELSRKIKHKAYRAFTFSELWEILPIQIFDNENQIIYQLKLHKSSVDGYMIIYYENIKDKAHRLIEKNSNLPQEAAAELALWCKKNKYL
jgi:hypothetical protein